MSISLPVASESLRCLDFALSNSIDPGGTGLGVDAVVLVEVARPWPKPVAKHDALIELVSEAQQLSETVRLLAAIPQDENAPRVIVFRFQPTGMTRAEAAIVGDGVAAFREAVSARGTPLATADGVRTVLVCTQGSHDQCCGTEGTALAEKLRADRPDLDLFEVSHTGGHRFAPTALTLPDGRMWAYLTPAAVGAIADRVEVEGMARHCRGWWGAPTGRAQVAERAVFDLLGFPGDLLERTVEVGVDGDPDQVLVTAGERAWNVRVEIGREVPTISCSVPGGEPVKPGREWNVVEIVEVDR